MAEGMTYLAVAYLGMLIAIALWTWTVFSRSNDLEQRIEAVERSMSTHQNEQE
ncbi:MAG: hypothetical protein VXW14_01030 [Candidatus Thermoplasmatota archaeon]|jgi:hypothetical protein|nr:hypothetical protein [Candidatus Thermoplasmatota archaeon]MEC7254095.1 hypothetical protein [Candidatus Thermoplasmatota archaeon]